MELAANEEGTVESSEDLENEKFDKYDIPASTTSFINGSYSLLKARILADRLAMKSVGPNALELLSDKDPGILGLGSIRGRISFPEIISS